MDFLACVPFPVQLPEDGEVESGRTSLPRSSTAFLYLQRLPQEIHVLLSEDDPADMRDIVEKADRLIAMHVPQGHDAHATVAADEKQETGVCGGNPGCQEEESQDPGFQATTAITEEPWTHSRLSPPRPGPGRQSQDFNVLLQYEVRRAGRFCGEGAFFAVQCLS